MTFSDLPVPQPARIVSLGTRVGAQRDMPLVSPREYVAFRDARTVIGDLAAFTGGTVNISDGVAPPQRLSTVYVTPNTFRTLGVSALMGRDFLNADDDPNAPPVAILSEAVWSGRYGRDPQIIGRSLKVNDRSISVIGVMPAGTTFPFDTEMWLLLRPWVATFQSRPTLRNLQSFARLADGISLTQARAQLESIGARLGQEFPTTNRNVVPTLMTFRQRYTWAELEQLAAALLAASVILYLISVLNIANLLVARAASREYEIGIRLALGAGHRDIASHVIAEVVILVSCAVVGSVAVAVTATQAMARALLTMGAHPYWWSFGVDARVAIFFVGAAALTIVIASAAPVLYALSRRNLTSLWAGGFAILSRTHVATWRSALIVLELIVTISLLTGAGLLLRTVAVVLSRHDALHPDHVLTANVVLSTGRYRTPDQIAAFQTQLQERLESFVSSGNVAMASHLPLKGGLVRSVDIEGVLNEPGASVTSVTAVSITPEYFRVLQIPMISGRAFTRDDGVPGRRVVIVNQRFMRAYVHASDAIGTRIRLGDERSTEQEPEFATVVGVVPDVSQRELGALQTEAVVYMPFRAIPQAYMYVMMRSAVDPLVLSRQMREAVQAVDVNLPVFDIQPMTARLASATVTWRAFEVGFFVLALISLILAAVGLYAVTMAWVTERNRELALRVALGATPTQVSWLVLGMVGRHFVIGVTLGLCSAAVLARSLRSVLIQTAAIDPVVLASCVGVIVAVGAAACIWPIKRAITLEPAATLRAE